MGRTIEIQCRINRTNAYFIYNLEVNNVHNDLFNFSRSNRKKFIFCKLIKSHRTAKRTVTNWKIHYQNLKWRIFFIKYDSIKVLIPTSILSFHMEKSQKKQWNAKRYRKRNDYIHIMWKKILENWNWSNTFLYMGCFTIEKCLLQPLHKIVSLTPYNSTKHRITLKW